MSDTPEKKITCYSDGESEFMAKSQAIRGQLLLPLMRVLGRCGVRPSHLTFASLLAGVAFCPDGETCRVLRGELGRRPKLECRLPTRC